MSKQEKKKSLRIVLALLTGVILIAVSNTRAFNDFCSTATFAQEAD
jgi:hypothetical protein